jgi:hypothetical protein
VLNNAGVRHGADIILRLCKCFAPLRFVAGRGMAIGLLVSVPYLDTVRCKPRPCKPFPGSNTTCSRFRVGHTFSKATVTGFSIEFGNSRITREFWFRIFYLQDKSLTDIVRRVKLFRSRDSLVGTVTVPGVRYPGSATYFCLFLNFQTASGSPSSGYRELLITVAYVLRENVLGKCN